MDFENKHLELITLYESCATDIEKAIFTNRYQFSENHYGLLAVQSISMLYSYWEGFVQNSFRLYIDFINCQSIKFREFSDSITVFLLEGRFKQLKDYPSKIEKKIKFLDGLEKFYSTDIQQLNRNVDTESNVGFNVLNGLLSMFSLDEFPERWDKYNYPNKTLKEMLDTFLRYRNGVAHGCDTSSEEKVTQLVYSKYRMMVVDLMYGMHERFLAGIEKTTYLKEEIV